MLPPAMQDPNASKYMTIEMGTNYSAGVGAALNQQILNFTLFNTLEIAKTAEAMASLGIESKEESNKQQPLLCRTINYLCSQAIRTKTSLSTRRCYHGGQLSEWISKDDLDRLKVNRKYDTAECYSKCNRGSEKLTQAANGLRHAAALSH